MCKGEINLSYGLNSIAFNSNSYNNMLYNQELLQKKQQNLLNANLEFQSDYALQQVQASNKNSTYTNRLKSQVATLMTLIKNDQLDQFQKQWNIFEEMVKNNDLYKYSIDTSDSKAVRSTARDIFHTISGSDIVSALNTSQSPFEDGVLSGMSMGLLGQSETVDDVVADLTGIKRNRPSHFAEWTGVGVGGALIGTAVSGIGYCYSSILSGKFNWKKLGITTIIGLVSGTVLAYISNIIQKIVDDKRKSNT